jgi:LPXTG-site transpeptidase (sortase) family protein
VPAAVLAALSFVGAATTWPDGAPSIDERPVAAAVEPTSEAAQPSIPATTDVRAGRPQRVLIESLGIDARVLPIVTRGRSLDPPADPQDLGWWSEGTRSGATRGTALITGHTVHDGGGALDDLETISTGAEIRVRTAHGMIRYAADSVAVLDKDTITRRAPWLFSQEADGRLVLVTCEDWDGTGYRSNVVVTATPIV